MTSVAAIEGYYLFLNNMRAGKKLNTCKYGVSSDCCCKCSYRRNYFKPGASAILTAPKEVLEKVIGSSSPDLKKKKRKKNLYHSVRRRVVINPVWRDGWLQ